MCEMPFGVFTFTLTRPVLDSVLRDQLRIRGGAPTIRLHPGNLPAPRRMPQSISGRVTACGGSECESPPQQAPAGPLIPRVANSFWLAISRPSLSAAVAAGAEGLPELSGNVFFLSTRWVRARLMLSALSTVINHSWLGVIVLSFLFIL